jgi:hypothetical protein
MGVDYSMNNLHGKSFSRGPFHTWETAPTEANLRRTAGMD